MPLLPDIVSWMIASTSVSAVAYGIYTLARQWLTATERYAVVRGGLLASPFLPLLLWAQVPFNVDGPQHAPRTGQVA